MNAIKNTQTYDFDTLLDYVTGASANAFVKRNTRFPTPAEVYRKLAALHEPAYRDHSPAFKWVLNAGLIERAALTERQEACKARNAKQRNVNPRVRKYTPNHRYQITEIGKRFMLDLRAVVFRPVVAETPKPEPVCRALMAPRDVTRLHVWQAYVNLCARPALVSSAFDTFERSGAVALDVCPF